MEREGDVASWGGDITRYGRFSDVESEGEEVLAYRFGRKRSGPLVGSLIEEEDGPPGEIS
jgi:hypothetical protein